MSEKEPKDQSVGTKENEPADTAGKTGRTSGRTEREDRLAEALRANLRRRKNAAKSRKDS